MDSGQFSVLIISTAVVLSTVHSVNSKQYSIVTVLCTIY